MSSRDGQGAPRSASGRIEHWVVAHAAHLGTQAKGVGVGSGGGTHGAEAVGRQAGPRADMGAARGSRMADALARRSRRVARAIPLAVAVRGAPVLGHRYRVGRVDAQDGLVDLARGWGGGQDVGDGLGNEGERVKL